MITRKSLIATAMVIMMGLGFMPATTAYAITLDPTAEATTTTSTTVETTKVTDVTTTTVTTVTETTHTVTEEHTVTTDSGNTQTTTPASTATAVATDPKAEATTTVWVEKRLSMPTFKSYKSRQKKLKWNKVKGADKYELWFYNQKNDKYLAKVETKVNSFDLSELRKALTKKQRKQTYYVKIYAVSNDKKVTRSAASVLRNVSVKKLGSTTSTNEKKTDYSGYKLEKHNDGYMYYTNGSKNATGWITIDDMKYYFDEKGRMQFCIFIK